MLIMRFLCDHWHSRVLDKASSNAWHSRVLAGIYSFVTVGTAGFCIASDVHGSRESGLGVNDLSYDLLVAACHPTGSAVFTSHTPSCLLHAASAALSCWIRPRLSREDISGTAADRRIRLSRRATGEEAPRR